MAKKVSNSRKVNSLTCDECGVCGTCKWLLPGVILVAALVPGWYNTGWAKWIIIISAVLLILKRWCPCQHKH